TAANGSGTAYANSETFKYEINGDLTLYAQWTPKSDLKIIYNANTGTGTMPDQTVTYDSNVTLTANAFSKTGYVFNGWNTAANGSGTTYANSETFKYEIDGDLTLYAQWTPKSDLKIIYDANTGTGTMADQAVTYDSNVTLTANAFSKTGYVFNGWNTAANGSGTAYANSETFKYEIDGDLTLYAQWTPKSDLKIIYDANTGTGTMADQVVTYDSNVTLTANAFSKTGYVFNGWNTEADGSGTVYADSATFKYEIDGDLTLYAQWMPENSLKITYNANTGTGTMADQVVTYDSNVTLTANAFSKTGYVFNGWNTEANGSGTAYANSATFKYEVDGDLTLYAQWTPDPHTVTYYANDGTGDEKTDDVVYDEEYEVEDNPFTPPTGYRFKGWNTAADGSGDDYEPGDDITIDDDVTLYAQWTPKSDLKIIYNANTGTGTMADQTVTYNSNVTLTANAFSKTGYVFNGWNTQADGTGTGYANSATFKYEVDGDLTLYAQWTPKNDLKIIYNANTGTGTMADQTVTYDSDVTLTVNAFSKTGYVFNGWNTQADGTGTGYVNSATFKYEVDGDLTLYAQWTPKSDLKIIYDANTGTGTMADQTVTYDSDVTLTANAFSKTGYVFNGWNTQADGTGTAYANSATFKYEVDGDLTLYAQWTPDPHTVTYKANGGAGNDVTDDVVYDEDYEVEDNPFTPPTGYTFKGWNTVADGSGDDYEPGDEITIDDDVTLYAQWTPKNDLKIIYNANTGTGTMADQTVTYDSNVMLTANAFIKTGYVFNGWNTQADGTGTAYANSATFKYEVDGDLTLYAQWTPDPHTVTYKANGGTGADVTDNVVYDEDYEVEDNPFTPPTGYTFKGWNTAADGSGDDYKPGDEITIDDDVTLYAQWTPDPHTVTYYANDGTGDEETDDVVYDEDYEVEDNPFTPPTGYTFKGWNTAADGSGDDYDPGDEITIDDDVTLYAQWAPDPHTVTYYANDGTGDEETDDVVYDEDYEVEDNPFTPPTGYTFKGWNTAADGSGDDYEPGDEITIDDDVTLYAQWAPNPYTVTYKANGGTGADITVNVVYDEEYEVEGNTFGLPSGYTFKNWNTVANGTGTAYTPGSSNNNKIKIDGDITLYAQWTSRSDLHHDDEIIVEIPPEEIPFDPFISDHVAYIIGYPEGGVRPGNNVTRAEVATVFFRLLTDLERSQNWTQVNNFTDVIASNWFNNAVSVMSNMGILNGYEDGTFRPNGAITRAELATIAARFARMMNLEGDSDISFTDVSGHWAQEDILYAAMIGWVNGYPDETFRPNQPITRAEFMTLVNRMMKRAPQSVDDLLVDDMVIWSDNMDPEVWYYLAVQEATNTHLPEYKEEQVPDLGFEYEKWVEMLENPDWAMLEKEWANGLLNPEQ
ncbi:MAG: InlB B-repeat-containing protein, partial [Oscillospiraceae bacterium]|nr:InlB B-repeat-containing protein [Oscillospiraceae bacterium]